MRTNPISDVLDFLTQGEWTSYVFALLALASVAIAAVNLWRDTSQRSVLHLWNWLARFFIGGLWWQQSLWKLPPTYTDNPDGSGGLRYWMGEMVKWASTGLQRHFVKEVVLPHFYFFAPQVYFSEVLIAVTLILGLFSRLGAFIGTLMAINLWLGLYRSPAEWPWTYFFLIIVQIMLLVQRPGRSLGLDAILLRRGQHLADHGLWGRLVRVLS
jgi:uncharacterized membrane protein YphA (DoxX/SURF4 family)